MAYSLVMEGLGYCGWCLHHALNFSVPPLDEGTLLGEGLTRWRIVCKLDQETIQSFSTCASWRAMFDGDPFLDPVVFSAHDKAELLRGKLATFRWRVEDVKPTASHAHPLVWADPPESR